MARPKTAARERRSPARVRKSAVPAAVPETPAVPGSESGEEFPAPVPSTAPDLVTGRRWGWYILSLVVPYAGLFVALFLYDARERATRRVGRNCLLIGFVVWVLCPALVTASFLLLGALTLANWLSQMVPFY